MVFLKHVMFRDQAIPTQPVPGSCRAGVALTRQRRSFSTATSGDLTFPKSYATAVLAAA